MQPRQKLRGHHRSPGRCAVQPAVSPSRQRNGLHDADRKYGIHQELSSSARTSTASSAPSEENPRGAFRRAHRHRRIAGSCTASCTATAARSRQRLVPPHNRPRQQLRFRLQPPRPRRNQRFSRRLRHRQPDPDRRTASCHRRGGNLPGNRERQTAAPAQANNAGPTGHRLSPDARSHYSTGCRNGAADNRCPCCGSRQAHRASKLHRSPRCSPAPQEPAPRAIPADSAASGQPRAEQLRHLDAHVRELRHRRLEPHGVLHGRLRCRNPGQTASRTRCSSTEGRAWARRICFGPYRTTSTATCPTCRSSTKTRTNCSRTTWTHQRRTDTGEVQLQELQDVLRGSRRPPRRRRPAICRARSRRSTSCSRYSTS